MIFKMTIESIAIEIDLQGIIGQLDVMAIETQIQRWGEPLRWAITSIDPERQIAFVEAIVIKE
jgi:hypothetical protein